MTLKIIKTIEPGVCYTDADTGRLDDCDKQASEPIRVLPAPIELKPVDEKDLEYIRKVLAYGLSSKLKYLPRLIGTTDDESTKSFIERGCVDGAIREVSENGPYADSGPRGP